MPDFSLQEMSAEDDASGAEKERDGRQTKKKTSAAVNLDTILFFISVPDFQEEKTAS